MAGTPLPSKGKLTPEQLKFRRRNIFLNEITPEWKAHEIERWDIDDIFEDATKGKISTKEYLQIFDACRETKASIPFPQGPLWLKGKEPHV